MKSAAVSLSLLLSFALGYTAAPQDPSKQDPANKQDPSQQDPRSSEGGKQPLTPEERRVAALKFSQPLNPQHVSLTGESGLWDVRMTLTYPGSPSRTSTGTSDMRPILGSRFVVEELRGDLGGTEYQGFGIRGYDPLVRDYMSVWMDNLSTQIHLSRGIREADDTLVLRGNRRDYIDPAGRPFRTEITVEKDKSITRRIYDTIDGKEVLVMEMVYTRRQ